MITKADNSVEYLNRIKYFCILWSHGQNVYRMVVTCVSGAVTSKGCGIDLSVSFITVYYIVLDMYHLYCVVLSNLLNIVH